MYYLRARYYRPELGRFWSMDTYEGNRQDPLSLHKYLYCAGNPANKVDPSGHEFTLVGLSIASGIAIGLQLGYDSTVAAAGWTIMNTLSAAVFGHTVDEMLPMVQQDVSLGDQLSYQLVLKGVGGDDLITIKAGFPSAAQSGVSIVSSFGSSSEQPRNALGQFMSKTAPGEIRPGTSAEDDFCALAEANGLEVIREVTYRTPFGNRRYDAVLRDPKTGEASGVEIKSSESAMNRETGSDARQQFAADRWINMKGQSGGVSSVGSKGGIRIKSTYKVQWR